jgi:uncharacterized surface protein with fasciclin (FAS1) repeats
MRPPSTLDGRGAAVRRVRPLVALALLLGACNDGLESEPITTIGASLEALGFRALDDAVVAAGLDDDLSGPGPFTLFAPTDQAFADLPPGQLAGLLDPANVATLVALLLNHALGGENDVAALTADGAPQTLQGSTLIVDPVLDGVFVNEARVLVGNIAADNGLVHGIDRVLRPAASLLETLAARDLGALVDAIDQAGLTATLQGPGPFTLFAPTDAAFDAATGLAGATQEELAERLLYHLVDGSLRASQAIAQGTLATLDTPGNALQIGASSSAVTVDGVPLELFNVPCTNGVLHVIGAVLEPPTAAAPASGGGADFTGLDGLGGARTSAAAPVPTVYPSVDLLVDPRARLWREGPELVLELGPGPLPTAVELWVEGVGAPEAAGAARLAGRAPDLRHGGGEVTGACLWSAPAGLAPPLELRLPARGVERARLRWLH